MLVTQLRIDMVSLLASGLRRARAVSASRRPHPTVAGAPRWMQRAKQIHASFELPAHCHQLSPDPGFDRSDRNPKVFGYLLMRMPVDDRQKHARAALRLKLIEHGP